MCQYSAVDGCATDWHVIHLGHLALSGAGLLMIEASAVVPEGRISRECLGLYSDANEEALRRVLASVRRFSSIPIGIQLNHAGRKGSQRKPADGHGNLEPQEAGWRVVGPSPVAFGPSFQTPQALDRPGMQSIVEAFAAATQRGIRLALDLIELHAAHGYLLSSFLSPLANHRSDEYGGSIENRMRFPLEVFRAMRKAWPESKPLGVRCNGTDWHEQGMSVDDAVAFARALKEAGCDYFDVTTGGNANVPIPIGPGYQVPFAARIREEVGIPTMAVGLIRDARQADEIVAEGKADLIAIGRGMLNDPRWPWHAAEELGAAIDYPVQYERGVRRDGTKPSARGR